MSELTHCRECGQALPADQRLARLLQRCAELGLTVASDGTVSSQDAAKLLGVHEQSLRQQRAYGSRCVPFVKRAGRVRYALRDLAGV